MSALSITIAGCRVLAMGLIVLLAGCDSGSPDGLPPAPSSSSPQADHAGILPTPAFADISNEPVQEEVAAELQQAVDDISAAIEGGVSATVMSPDGTWSGTAGKADGVRDLTVKDQFNIGSISKSLVAAQVMQLVEAGGLNLDDPASDHLPRDLKFDTNGATIRHLLAMRSGIPDYWQPEFDRSLSADPRRVWTTKELLASIPAWRETVDTTFRYSSTNYVLLALVIEQVGGRPLVEELRDGVLDVAGTERLISQPDERPTAPMAMPLGHSTEALKEGGGYLPSVASVTSNGPGAVMASDAPSLARWWRALCAGEIVSQDSLVEMTTYVDGYGLGLYNPYGQAVGHTGADVGYAAWAGCLPDDGAVVVVMSNQVVDDLDAMAGPLVTAVETESP